MSVVVLADGAPFVDTMDEAETAARALETDVIVFTTEHDRTAPVGGAARTVTVTGLGPFSVDTWLVAFGKLLAGVDAQLVMMADSAHARAFFPALAARLGTPLLSAATRVRVLRRDRLEVERPLHGGLQSERLVVATPLFTTLLSSNPAPARAATTAEIGATESTLETVAAAVTAEPRDAVLKVIPPNAETVDIRSADRIVAGGLGLGSKEAVALLGRIAKPLHAAVGGTRVISDRGWLEHERYIGSTGKTVAPKLYVALGISGASQHLVGMTESEAIIAVNTDRAAPIFGVADLGIVGDLHRIIPELEKRLAKEPT